MKKITYSLLIIALLSGCAKVTQDAAPCIGTRPVGTYVSNVIIPSGGSTYINAITLYGYNAVIHWSGPNGFSTTTTGGNNLYLDFSSSNNYGLYTATVFYNGCSSIPDTFYVSGSLTGSPSCSVSIYNTLQVTDGTTLSFTGSAYRSNGYCSAYMNNIYNNNSTYTFNLYTMDALGSGSYSQLQSLCPSNSGQSYVAISYNGTNLYQSISGNVYCNTIGGQTYITFCNATFVNESTGRNVNITGNLVYYP